jgi:N6-adenosine-specific RNA methylase IME4
MSSRINVKREAPAARLNAQGLLVDEGATPTLTASKAQAISIDRIVVGERHRKDMGDVAGLGRSISEIGLLHPIVIKRNGELIAGARRLRACVELGWTEIPVHVVDLDEIVHGEFAENAVRKDFTLSEAVAIKRAIEPLEKVAAKERQGARTDKHLGKLPTSSNGRAADNAAKATGISRRTLEKAEDVINAAEGDPKRFAPLVDEMDRTGKVDWVHQKLRRAHHQARLIEISNNNAPLPTDRKYPVILADPPWQFKMFEQGTRSPEDHYGTMPLDEICALEVPNLATPDAVLFLWAPSALLFSHAKPVLDAWGFTYRVNIVWVKEDAADERTRNRGLGWYVRQHHELMLVATRGTRILPDPSTMPSSVIYAPRREHSRKPDEAYARIERMYPELPKIELFARGPARPGWKPWGNEAEPPSVAGNAARPPPDHAPPPARDPMDIPASLRRAAP